MAEDNSIVEWNLQLKLENVLNGFIKAFSYPDTITFEGECYNLTKAYDTFWSQFFANPLCSDKFRKFPKPSLGNEKLKSLARIIKRGWQDERYLPTKFSEYFLRSCIFGDQSYEEISAEMILDFIDDEKEVKKLLNNKSNQLDENSLKVLKTYCPDAPVSIPITIEKACVIVVKTILDEIDEIIKVWIKELKDLSELKDFVQDFEFIMKERKACLSRETPYKNYDDLTNLEEDLPHMLWTTFFKGWSTKQIDFYFNMLHRNTIECICGGFGSKHLMGNDLSNCGDLVSTDRHDWVLDKIEEKLKGALDKEGTFFSSGKDWIVLRRIESMRKYYAWPKELDIKDSFLPLPHLLVYSLVPKKKVMIVENSVMWEEWYKLSPDDRQYKTKTKEFMSTVDQLKENGFEVIFKDIEMGCRGVLSRELYHLFKEDFKMKHGEISKSLEEVSKGIVNWPCDKYLKNQDRLSLKRKFEDLNDQTQEKEQ